MKAVKYLIAGIAFGIILTKSEAVSWYRIQEMFLFDSFHMYGIIGTAVVLGLLGMQFIKHLELRASNGQIMSIPEKSWSVVRYLIGGILFGLGWAMTGACPGPMFALLGHGYPVVLAIFLSALAGTFVYGIIREKLPH